MDSNKNNDISIQQEDLDLSDFSTKSVAEMSSKEMAAKIKSMEVKLAAMNEQQQANQAAAGGPSMMQMGLPFEEKFDEFKKKVEKLDQENKVLIKEIEGMKDFGKKIAEMEEKIREKERQMREMKEEIGKLGKENGQLKKDLEGNGQKWEEIKNEMAEIKEEIRELKAAKEEKKPEFDGIKEENRKMKEEIGLLKEQKNKNDAAVKVSNVVKFKQPVDAVSLYSDSEEDEALEEKLAAKNAKLVKNHLFNMEDADEACKNDKIYVWGKRDSDDKKEKEDEDGDNDAALAENDRLLKSNAAKMAADEAVAVDMANKKQAAASSTSEIIKEMDKSQNLLHHYKKQSADQLTKKRERTFPIDLLIDYINSIYGELRVAFQKILQQQNTKNLSSADLNLYVYTMVLHKHAGMLYDGLNKIIREHLQTMVRERIIESINVDDDHFIEVFNNSWKEHTLSMTMICNICLYLDRVYIVQAGVIPVYQLGLDIFGTEIVNYPTIKEHLKTTFGEDLMQAEGKIDASLFEFLLKHV